MKKFTFFALLALIPLYSFSTSSTRNDIYGYWEDYHTGISLKIKSTKRNGILIKRTDRRNGSRWVRYDRLRRNLYDDCYGSRIKLTSYGLKWSTNFGRKTIYLERSNGRRGDYYDRDYGYDGFEDERRNSINTDYLGGRWYCSDYNVEIEIGYRNKGIRVKRLGDSRNRNDWYEYSKSDRNSQRYYGDHGNYYELRGRDLVFNDLHNKKKMKFRRR